MMEQMRMHKPSEQELEILRKKWIKATVRERKMIKVAAQMRVAVVIVPLLALLMLTSFHAIAMMVAGSVLTVTLIRTMRKLSKQSKEIRQRQLAVDLGDVRVAQAVGKHVIPSHSPRKNPSIEVQTAWGQEGTYDTMWYFADLISRGQEDFPVLLVQVEKSNRIFAVPL